MYYRYWMHAAHHNVCAHYGIRTLRYKLIYYYGDALGQPGAIDAPWYRNGSYSTSSETRMSSTMSTTIPTMWVLSRSCTTSCGGYRSRWATLHIHPIPRSTAPTH